MNFLHSGLWKRVAAMFVLATASLLVMTATSFAQGHDQGHERRELKDHQRQERYYNHGYATRDHQRAERGGYNNNGGYYGNGHSNNGYYNNGLSNGGYYTRRPHYDSRSFGNRLHHAFGGH